MQGTYWHAQEMFVVKNVEVDDMQCFETSNKK